MGGVQAYGLTLTVHLDELIQAGEDVLQFFQGEEAPLGHGLVEEVMQHPQHAHVGCLCHQQLCRGAPKAGSTVEESVNSGGWLQKVLGEKRGGQNQRG